MTLVIPDKLFDRLRGLYLAFDGPEGCGKSTVSRRLAGDLRAAGHQVTEVREPGGTYYGEEIRKILLNHGRPMEPETEVLLFMAARAQLVREVVRPVYAPEGGYTVIPEGSHTIVSDRWASSTFAYQGYASGLGMAPIMDVLDLAVPQPLRPDLVVILDVPLEVTKARLGRRGTAYDRIESKGDEYLQRVREGYRAYAEAYALDAVIDASGPPDEVYQTLLSRLQVLCDRCFLL